MIQDVDTFFLFIKQQILYFRLHKKTHNFIIMTSIAHTHKTNFAIFIKLILIYFFTLTFSCKIIIIYHLQIHRCPDRIVWQGVSTESDVTSKCTRHSYDFVEVRYST